MHFEIVRWYFYYSGTIFSYDRISTLKRVHFQLLITDPRADSQLIKQKFELPFEINQFLINTSRGGSDHEYIKKLEKGAHFGERRSQFSQNDGAQIIQ